MALLPWLIAAVLPVATKLLVGLGFGFVAYTALSTLANTAINTAQANYNNLDLTILQLVNLGGGGVFLGLISSALVAKAGMLAMKKLQLKSS
jgi:hypothetical protein